MYNIHMKKKGTMRVLSRGKRKTLRNVKKGGVRLNLWKRPRPSDPKISILNSEEIKQSTETSQIPNPKIYPSATACILNNVYTGPNENPDYTYCGILLIEYEGIFDFESIKIYLNHYLNTNFKTRIDEIKEKITEQEIRTGIQLNIKDDDLIKVNNFNSNFNYEYQKILLKGNVYIIDANKISKLQEDISNRLINRTTNDNFNVDIKGFLNTNKK